MSTEIFILTNIVGQTSKYDFESGHRVKYSSIHQTNIKYEFLVLNNPWNPILSSIVSQLKTNNIFKMAAATILNLDKGLNIKINHQNNIVINSFGSITLLSYIEQHCRPNH